MIILSACDNDRIQKSERNDRDKNIVPFIRSSHKDMAFPGIFEAAFSPDTKAIQGDNSYFFYRQELGLLKCESGQIIACGPSKIHQAPPLDYCFPSGIFPVHLAIAKKDNDEKIAFARIVFSDRKVDSWKIVNRAIRKSIALQDSCKSCYKTTSGKGMFIGAFSKDIFEKIDEDLQEDTFFNEPKNFRNSSLIHEFDNYNLAIFPSGVGPGCYKTYLGFDKRGRICQLLTDFKLIYWWNLKKK